METYIVSVSQAERLTLGRRAAEMPIGVVGCYAAARRALQKAELEEEWLVNVFDCLNFFLS